MCSTVPRWPWVSCCQSLLQAQKQRGCSTAFSLHTIPHTPSDKGHSACGLEGKQSAMEKYLGWSPGNSPVVAIDVRTARVSCQKGRLCLFSFSSPCAPSTYSSNSSLYSCNLMATVQFSSCSLVQTRCDISLMFQMLVQHRCLNPFQGLLLLQYLALYSVLVEQHWDPPLPSLRLRGVSRAGGFFVCPHHLPHVLSIQEPAGGLHWDPSSLISFNSSLKAESPRKQK